MDAQATAPLVSAGLLLARTGILGFAWLDGDLDVTARFGELTERLEVGEPLSDGLPILADYTDDILALPDDGSRSLELPGLLIFDRDRPATPRIDIHVFGLADPRASTPRRQPAEQHASHDADAQARQFLLLVTRASGQASIDLAVARYQRDRRILLEEIEQKKIELDRAYAELALCNRDLEDFAAIISHDLKAPMRSLRYLADDIKTSLLTASGDVPPAALSACDELQDQSRRMSTMLSQLLDYASLGRQKDALETIDSRSLVASIAGSLPAPPGFVIAISGDWPTFDTLVAPLDLVLRNLIDNAIKHHDRPHEGHIALTAKTDGPHLRITVADNGPGIPKGRQDAVFLPFRSYPAPGAESPAEADSSSQGMGLAFVKRTLENAGGRLSLDSDPATGRGSRFVIAWPLVPLARVT